MSQIQKLFDGTVKPDIETITGNSGGAVGPNGAFNINIVGGTGITVTGNPATNTLTITQAEELHGSGTTIGAVTSDLITIPLGAVPGVSTFDIRVAAFDATTPLGVGYTLVGAVRTTGAAAVLIPGQSLDQFEEIALVGATAAIVVAGNNAIIRATGVAGITLNWVANAEFITATQVMICLDLRIR